MGRRRHSPAARTSTTKVNLQILIPKIVKFVCKRQGDWAVDSIIKKSLMALTNRSLSASPSLCSTLGFSPVSWKRKKDIKEPQGRQSTPIEMEKRSMAIVLIVNLLGVRVGSCSDCQKHVASPAGTRAHLHSSSTPQSGALSTPSAGTSEERVSLQVNGASDLVSDVLKLSAAVRAEVSVRRRVDRPTERQAERARRQPARRWAGTATRPASATAHSAPRPPELIKAANTAGHADNAALSCVQNSFN
uniref:SFRICE_029301 n=1 Tax=Spodoptera frugiperda TaxID=7108 RepID=A0A2H1V1V0_SPOFR